MPSFFIDRPIFAWVVALFICLIGAISIPLLAVAQYPIIAPPSISISTSYPGASPENLYNSVTRLIEEELNGANGILNFESTSDSLGQVEIIANFGVGVDQIDLDAARQRGIIVTNTANVLNDCVADCAMALVLNTLRKFPQADKYLRAGLWKTKGTYPFTTSLGGKTLGILGLGRIGKEIARRAAAFKMNIRYHNRNKKNVPYAYDPDAVTLAKNSDVLLVITPGGADTDKLVNAKVQNALGAQGYLVNVARG